MKGNILLIDDEEKLRNLLARIIRLEGFEVIEAGDCKSAMLKLEQQRVDVALCDVKLPDGNGIDLTNAIKDKYPHIEIILLTAYGNIPDGVQAIKNGAFDYITKGDDNNKIIVLLERATEKAALTRRVQSLEKQLNKSYSFDNITGQSKAIREAIDAAQKVAATDAAVLLTGETGVGKEIFAQAIHSASPRNKFNFVAVNCSAFSKELLENELFGHKAGAFTGALKDTKGILEEAHRGTVFLDEIGEMPLELQAKLLRVIETGEYFKVGDSKPSHVNVRLVAATNRNLQLEIEKGNFREDLYYRISVFQIFLPPLRDRIEDIEELAHQFLLLFAKKTNKSGLFFSAQYIAALKRHRWKGNIRELKNIIERSVILADHKMIDTDSLPSEFYQASAAPASTPLAFELAAAEKVHIQKVLEYTRGNKTEAARLLNIALTTLYRKIEEYKLN